MKMIKVMVAATVMGLTSLSMANTIVNQNAVAPQVTTVKQALSMRDDTNVKLKGYVVKSIGNEKYYFRDATGTIVVDIDDELWMGHPVSANTPVTLIGEVDIDYKPTKRVEIDVDVVQF